MSINSEPRTTYSSKHQTKLTQILIRNYGFLLFWLFLFNTLYENLNTSYLWKNTKVISILGQFARKRFKIVKFFIKYNYCFLKSGYKWKTHYSKWENKNLNMLWRHVLFHHVTTLTIISIKKILESRHSHLTIFLYFCLLTDQKHCCQIFRIFVWYVR